MAQLAAVALAQRERLVHADRALVLAATAEHRAEREVWFDVVDVLFDHRPQLVDDRIRVTRDQVADRAHVGAGVARAAAKLSIVGDVVAPEQDTGSHRAESDEQ